ncbi:hypothetical protein PALB_14150 [Pseudoalteromonas luteoviolacea B = ATCC 29581]|nr:hypothetical protein PALB_14150 [Pseudoalteromonas luteoviolacea B = ATCC 29581]
MTTSLLRYDQRTKKAVIGQERDRNKKAFIKNKGFAYAFRAMKTGSFSSQKPQIRTCA